MAVQAWRSKRLPLQVVDRFRDRSESGVHPGNLATTTGAGRSDDLPRPVDVQWGQPADSEQRPQAEDSDGPGLGSLRPHSPRGACS